MENLLLANLEDDNNLTESVNRALKLKHFTIHTGLKQTPFDIHHGREPRTELTNTIKDGKSYPSDWSELSVSLTNKPNIPIYVEGMPKEKSPILR